MPMDDRYDGPTPHELHIERVTKAEQEVFAWAQAVLTALNVGDIKSGSPLHLKLREVMIAYREAVGK